MLSLNYLRRQCSLHEIDAIVVSIPMCSAASHHSHTREPSVLIFVVPYFSVVYEAPKTTTPMHQQHQANNTYQYSVFKLIRGTIDETCGKLEKSKQLEKFETPKEVLERRIDVKHFENCWHDKL